MRMLDPAGYRRMPWANGRGVTVEIARADDDAGMLWRLSMAQVVENGPFSAFPGIDRSLTVIDGPGFTLAGDDWRLRADPLVPAGFAGDVPVSATDVAGPAEDLNVMWRCGVLAARVRVATGAMTAAGSVVALVALVPQRITVDGTVFHATARACLIGDGALRIVADGAVVLAELSPAG
jgi:uncharacterized protein